MDYPKSVPSVGLVNGKFVDENPVNGTPGSLIPAVWGNSITDEVVNVIKASGLVPDESDPGQLLLSIQKMNQSDSVKYALDTGGAGAYAASYTPPLKALVDGLVLRFKAQNGNPGASTFSPNGLTAAPIVGAAHSALQGGEIVANGDVWVQWNSSIGTGSWVLIDSTGGGMQIAKATQSRHAMQFGQVSGVVGQARNLRASVTAAAATVTFTADEIIVETALGGLRYCLPNFNQTVNLATTGANGMDTGAAPVNGYVAIYAIYNPVTATSALLGVNATSAAAPTIYGGANMPSGYTASALISVLPTNGSGQIKVCSQIDRSISISPVQVFLGGSGGLSLTPFSLSGAVPFNAVNVSGGLTNSSSMSSNCGLTIDSTTTSIDTQNVSGTVVAGGAINGHFAIDVFVPQILYVSTTNTAGIPTYTVSIGRYSI